MHTLALMTPPRILWELGSLFVRTCKPLVGWRFCKWAAKASFPILAWKGLKLQWSQALHDVPIGQFNQPCISKEEEEDFFCCYTYNEISVGSLSLFGQKRAAFSFTTLGWKINCFMTWWLLLHLDEHAAAYPFETVEGNNIVDRER